MKIKEIFSDFIMGSLCFALISLIFSFFMPLSWKYFLGFLLFTPLLEVGFYLIKNRKKKVKDEKK